MVDSSTRHLSTRRGVALSAGLLAAALAEQSPAAVPAALTALTLRAATGVAAGQAVTAGAASARVVFLTEGMVKTMSLQTFRTAVAAGLAGLQEARARLLAMQSDERQADSYSVAEALRALDGATI